MFRHDLYGLYLVHITVSVAVFEPFRKTYHSGDMEKRIFAKLDEWTEFRPLFDVTFEGHSLDSVLTMVGSIWYATNQTCLDVKGSNDEKRLVVSMLHLQQSSK